MDRNEGEPEMSFKKFTTSAAVIAALAVANLSPLATAASAHDGRYGGGYDRGYSRYDDGPRYRGYDYGPRYRYGYKRHRHNHGKDIAKGLAIGLGVLAVGTILSHGR